MVQVLIMTRESGTLFKDMLSQDAATSNLHTSGHICAKILGPKGDFAQAILFLGVFGLFQSVYTLSPKGGYTQFLAISGQAPLRIFTQTGFAIASGHQAYVAPQSAAAWPDLRNSTCKYGDTDCIQYF